MKKIGLLFSTLYVIGCGFGSRTSNHPPPQKDTSYSIAAEYNKHIGNYPFIKIPEPVNADSFRKISRVQYAKTGKRKLYLDAVLPIPTKKKLPALIFIHGGGWRSGYPQMHEALAQRIALDGVACFLPEYRLSTEAKFPAGIEDIIQSVQWLKWNATKFHIDTSMIFLGGHSAGGEMATYIGARYPADLHLAGIINADGIVAFIHPESGEGDDSKRLSAATQWFGASKTQNPSLWKEASPLTWAGPTTPPVLFVNSSVERMHAGRDDMMQILASHGVKTELFTLEKAPHSFILFDPWITQVAERMVAFIQSNR